MARLLKRLEAAWRHGWIRLLARVLARSNETARPDWSSRPHRVLYLRYDRIGDMILATPLIRALATSHPGISVDVLASPLNAPVLEGNPWVRRIQLFDRRDRASYLRVLRALRRERYDAVVDDLGAAGAASLTRTLIMLATGAPHRIGVAGQENDYIYTIAVPPGPPGHTIETSAVVARAFGVEPRWTEWRPSVELSDDERAVAEAAWKRVADESGAQDPRRLLVNVSATHAIRRWPDERFVALLRDARVRHPDLAVAVIGTPAERTRIEAIARDAGASAVQTASVRQAIALVAGADVVLTPDTSITHAATAFEIPVVVILRPSMARFLPWRTPHRAVWVASESFTELPVEPVAEALESLLAETARGAPA